MDYWPFSRYLCQSYHSCLYCQQSVLSKTVRNSLQSKFLTTWQVVTDWNTQVGTVQLQVNTIVIWIAILRKPSVFVMMPFCVNCGQAICHCSACDHTEAKRVTWLKSRIFTDVFRKADTLTTFVKFLLAVKKNRLHRWVFVVFISNFRQNAGMWDNLMIIVCSVHAAHDNVQWNSVKVRGVVSGTR